MHSPCLLLVAIASRNGKQHMPSVRFVENPRPQPDTTPYSRCPLCAATIAMSGACVATNGALGARGVLLPAMVVANLQKSYMFHKGTFVKAHSLCDSKSKIDLHLHSLASGSCLLALAVGACKRRRNFPASEGFCMNRLFAVNRRDVKRRRF